MWLDIVLIAPLIWGAYIGFKKGLIAQTLGLASIVIGVWLGTQHTEYAHLILEDKVDPKYLSIASFIFIFLTVVITGAIIIKVLEKLVNLIQLKFLNKIGGIVLGITKVFAFLVIAIFTLESWDTQNLVINKSVKQTSLIYPILSKSSKIIVPNIKAQTIINLPELKKEEILQSAD
jgi:membrane protein required for colicin V production